MTDTAPTPLPPGEIQFFDSFAPGLVDGTYQLSVTQSLTAPGASIDPATQTFRVQGPRFSLDPADIHAEFPPTGSTGTFETSLAHVAFTKRLLPWERAIPGTPTGTPWLALLVFTDGELVGDAGSGDYAQTVTVATLLATDPGVRKPTIDPSTLSADDLASSCQAITVDSSLFVQIVPTARELTLLAHARQVAVASKAPQTTKDDGWFSVVVGNRFPMAGDASHATKSIVHLVSLEGFGDLLGGVAPQAPTQPQIQLVSLASWTFSCLADPAQTFAGLAQNLAYDPSQDDALRPADSLVLRLPSGGGAGSDPAGQRVAGGYVALGYHARSGEDGFAWYRGPFAPVVPNAIASANTWTTGDAAIVYDPATGVFDLSLATAWQLGRSLALADTTFTTTLLRVRSRANAAVEAGLAGGDVHAQLAAVAADEAFSLIHRAVAGRDIGTVDEVEPPSRAGSLARIQTALADPQVQAQLAGDVADDPDAPSVAAWLGQMLLLRGVPFVHLVPDARMLPPESIRFFYLDPNWTSALVDGALSVGLATSRDLAVQSVLTGQLESMAQAAALRWRSDQLGQPPPPAPSGPTSGFLLRSALVTGWPGIGVHATSAGAPVPLLRLEQVGDGVMIAVFDGVPDSVVLEEPHEGLEFGVDDDGAVITRIVSPPDVTNGPAVPVYDPQNPGAAGVGIRTGGERVLNIDSDPSPPSGPPPTPVDLRELLAHALDVDATEIGPAAFAIQMIKGPDQLVFSLTPPVDPG